MKPKIILVVFSVMLLIISGCGKKQKEPARSMEELREKNGVPVRIEKIQLTSFTQNLTFFPVLKGAKESVKLSMVNDRVERIKASVGSSVKEGRIVVTFPKNNPALQYEQAKIAFENAEKTYNRMKALLESGDISQDKYDGVKAQYDASKRNYESIKQLIYVEAPISGTIISCPINEGDFVGQGQPLFTVAQLGRMIARVNVSSKEISSIQKGMTVNAYWEDMKFEGKVTEIPLQMDDKSRAFPVEITISNPQRILISGVTVKVEIATYNKPESIVINRNFIQKEDNKQFVYVANGNIAEKRYIETGNEHNIEIEVTDGLKPGDMLITEGINLLDDGTKIQVIQ